jgi:hypothetical protein
MLLLKFLLSHRATRGVDQTIKEDAKVLGESRFNLDAAKT